MAKAHGEIRQSQLITTFGPGSLVDLPRYSVIMAGLDSVQVLGREIIENRLLAKIKRIPNLQNTETLNEPPAQRDVFGTDTSGFRAYIFPKWYATTQVIGKKHRWLVPSTKVKERKYEDNTDGKKYSVVPVRFLRACKKGHISDINWKEFIHRGKTECKAPVYMLDEIGNSGDASDVIASCGACGASRHLIDAKDPSPEGLGFCNGDRPWLGYGAAEDCKDLAKLTIRNASNNYFPQTIGVISIPYKENITLGDKIIEHLAMLGNITDKMQIDVFRTIPKFKEDFKEHNNDQIWKCLEEIKRTGKNPDAIPLKDQEFETLFSSDDEVGEDWPAGNFYSKAIKRENWGSDPFLENFSRIVLVHRLREVRALVGFSRIDRLATGIDGELDQDDSIHRASLSLNSSKWIPAVENRGEGIFIGFDKNRITKWVNKEPVKKRYSELLSGIQRLYKDKEKDFNEAEDFPGMPYYMLHSFAHMLITAVSLECGYPASSIKERIYCSKHGYGILLYTGSPDAEGTLGGLIEVGRNISKYIKLALEMGELCSNDPVCSEHNPENALDDKYLLGAACHGCLLIAETSCEMSNNYLDRSLVVPVLNNSGCEFFNMDEV
jgi:Domain of unknown function (DUF1998)